MESLIYVVLTEIKYFFCVIILNNKKLTQMKVQNISLEQNVTSHKQKNIILIISFQPLYLQFPFFQQSRILKHSILCPIHRNDIGITSVQKLVF